ncbi:Uncharacterised protein [Mycobacteroides abscessus subsp. abscessus]|nr:Uncharacterised protein [Mycobacteroides abscessus subsp. abscessus]SKR19339.1 Uncharacterised protein [Mycobacteroides abscessus subsp. abscessus]SKR64268.1 Uncharacterised protein [Mycobacteroides abscessus subsp. abscessus]SKT42370.1 Uncharacterised protein [Mycobacteroides abscessus subsp. abscessus]
MTELSSSTVDFDAVLMGAVQPGPTRYVWTATVTPVPPDGVTPLFAAHPVNVIFVRQDTDPRTWVKGSKLRLTDTRPHVDGLLTAARVQLVKKGS